MQWKTVCFQCLQEVYNYHDPANNILFKEELCSRRLAQRVLMWWFFRKLCPFYWIILCFQFVPFAMCSIVEICQMYYVVVDIAILFLSWSTLNLHCVFIKLAFESCLLHHVYIFNVVDIAMSAKIESKSFQHCSPCILFTLSTLLISQWWHTLILHRIYIVSIIYYLN